MNVKKAAKLVGNILTIGALVLIARRLLLIDIDYTFLLQRNRILWMLVLTVLYGINVATTPIAWCLILKITTGQTFPFLIVQKVFCKSNLLKYIPGNVFQYVGRNEIAMLYDVRHRDVALSTVLDIGANVIGVIVVAVVCYATGFQIGLKSIGAYISWPVIMIGLLCAGVIALVLYKKRALYLHWVKRLCTRRNLMRYSIGIGIYMFFAVYTALIYYVILTHILEVTIAWNTSFIVIGAYLLSWLLGFLVLGAPGGVGVRETVIVALLAAYMPTDPVLLAIIIYRIVNTLGDLLAFLGNACVLFLRRPKVD